MVEYGLGRLPAEDPNDERFPMQAVLTEEPVPDDAIKYHWTGGWWGDQGSTPQCVVYSAAHYIEDGPVTYDATPSGQGPPFDLVAAYNWAQNNDEWSGTNYDGTSVRAGVKYLQHIGLVSEYRWAWSIEPVIRALVFDTPVMFGSRWYHSMFYPDSKGFVKVEGNVAGGHAYLLNGINLKSGFVRFKNSWGRAWGKRGFGYMSLESLEKLITENGEACIAVATEEPVAA